MSPADTSEAPGHAILMVDDTPANLAVLAHVLEERGDRVLVAQDGEEALQRAEFAKPDLILLDVMMPGIDGFETCRRLKAQEALRDVPVIFMTALSDSNDKLRGFAAGGVDYVTKPFQIEEVLARIDTHLALRSAHHRLAEQNALLQHEVGLRQQAEAFLQRAHDLLEERVAQRTDELARANALLTGQIDERMRIEESLRRSEARMRRLIESNIIGIFFWHVDGRIVEANDAFLRLVGYTQQDVKDGLLCWKRLTPPGYVELTEQAEAELRTQGSFVPYEKEYVRKDGSRVPVLVGGAVTNTAQQTGVAFVLDLSERKLAEERIRYMADHDALTGLPNRALLQDRLHQAVAHAQRTREQVAVLFIDLDYFKHINDSLGHQVGDCLLQFVAERLKHCVREGDSVARLGGDEFVLALPLIGGSGADVGIVAQKVLDALDQPFHCGNHELHVSGSIGISLFPDDGRDVESLMRAADTAMYYAKEKGRGNYQFFTQGLNKAAQRRHQIGNALRHALARNELALHYQPQVDLRDGKIFSAEALLRWRRDGRSMACTEFITIAEETGLILPIGEWVLREACSQLRRWHDLGFNELVIAVNLSPRQFYQPNFLDVVREILDESGVPADRLDLEITEGILMQRTEDNVTTLNELSDMGIKLSIDDFGTGYSSLAYLQRFPVDALKIDRSFVSGIGQDSNDTALVSAIISMAQSLRLKVLAEGVETAEQIDFLQSHGCPWGQGFYYSRPVAADAFTALLHRQSTRAAHA